jgi:hypothetical protein
LGGLADAALNIFKKFILFLFWAPAHAFRVVIGCFAAIHAIGVGFPRRPLAQSVCLYPFSNQRINHSYS